MMKKRLVVLFVLITISLWFLVLGFGKKTNSVNSNDSENTTNINITTGSNSNPVESKSKVSEKTFGKNEIQDNIQSKSGVVNPKEINSQNIKSSDYEKTLQKILNNLPRKSNLKSLDSSETHGTPKIIFHSAEKIAQIVDHLDNHPENKKIALQFFIECAKQEDIALSIRATCLSLARKTNKELNRSELDFRLAKEVEKLSW